MRIVNTTAFGWIDMDHVLRVTTVEWEENLQGRGGYCAFYVYCMMRNKPFKWTGKWCVKDEATPEQLNEASKALRLFLLQWQGI